ncbi:protein ASPARTIC PROTEASE IN GUARD CELL 1-like [Nicotiana tabacum]|uniref:Protein ASPARTIC PROTEASE IN GUARD CELL 1-like n=1 Tax=Nicotiana tabacum TaxID=4097 RepID=A0A1S4A1Y5_TOBAC
MENQFHIHLLVSIIFSILFSVSGNETSFSSLNSTYIKQAKERFMSLDPPKLPDPPMPSYTFTIYNRDVFEKSKFKDYDSLLESRLARCHARASYLASIFDDDDVREGMIPSNDNQIGANETLTRQHDVMGSKIGRVKVPKTTSTYSANGEYVASFLLGTEEVKSFLLIDTGSDLLWWQCGPCAANKCYKQTNPLYIPTNSKIFRKVNCILHGEKCLDGMDRTYKCTTYTHQCLYDMKFTSGERSKGYMADDVITFVLDQRQVRVTFGCGTDQRGRRNFSGEYSGIVGLGRRILSGAGFSLPTQFGADLMSMCLPRFFSGKGSTLSFLTTAFPRTTSAKLLPNYKYPLFYYVNLYKVFVNDKVVPVSPSWWNFKRGVMGGVLVDTGTSITRFPKDFYIIFRYIFRAEVRDIPLAKSPFASLDTCYKEDPNGHDLDFPVVKLYFGSVNPNNMLLLAKERVLLHYRGLYCLAFMGWNRSRTVLGSNQLQGIGLTFDTSENTLSFDLDACD